MPSFSKARADNLRSSRCSFSGVRSCVCMCCVNTGCVCCVRLCLYAHPYEYSLYNTCPPSTNVAPQYAYTYILSNQARVDNLRSTRCSFSAVRSCVCVLCASEEQHRPLVHLHIHIIIHAPRSQARADNLRSSRFSSSAVKSCVCVCCVRLRLYAYAYTYLLYNTFILYCQNPAVGM